MVHINVLDPSASPLDYYGFELRRHREAAGLTQKQLGQIVNYTGSLVGQIETARKLPTLEFSERCDAALGTEGLLSRLIDLVLRSELPAWFRQIAELESRATEIQAFHTHLIHGLLQTEEYARAVLGYVDRTGLDRKVAARLGRQRILENGQAPLLWLVLDEGVLHRQVGGAAVMRKQLAHLLGYEANPRVNVQVLPFGVGAHAGSPGPFDMFRFSKDPAIVYTEDYETGRSTANPERVGEHSLRYAHLQAAALSPVDSALLIRSVMEERYGEHPLA
ncbi:Scr1 family TA system antitoxin-like transcriptional regulator [Streptomyces sp. NPDC050145]|uniref:helix-turn-helix domain-containing protein n=1 Tax=Streptomyces sp. NPDC050145 TaxID=3365602 RepID=UPI0037B7CD03